MSRLTDVFIATETAQEAIEIGKQLVADHVSGASYVIPMRTFSLQGNEVVENKEAALLIVKSKDTVFHSKLIPAIKQRTNTRVEVSVLPPIDVIDDYREWLDEEIHE